jgi:uncharacterized protein Veg
MYECFQIKSLKSKKKLKKEKGKVGNTYTSYFLFCHTGVKFFVIVLTYIYVKRAQP